MLRINLESREYSLIELEELVCEELIKTTKELKEVEFICNKKTFDFIEQEAIRFKNPTGVEERDLKLKKVYFYNGIEGVFNVL